MREYTLLSHLQFKVSLVNITVNIVFSQIATHYLNKRKNKSE